MDRLICKDCGYVFDDSDAEVIREDPSPAGISLPTGYYEYPVCPECGSDYLADAEECMFCGDEYDKDELIDGACRDCASSLRDRLSALINDSFTFEEAHWLMENY